MCYSMNLCQVLFLKNCLTLPIAKKCQKCTGMRLNGIFDTWYSIYRPLYSVSLTAQSKLLENFLVTVGTVWWKNQNSCCLCYWIPCLFFLLAKYRTEIFVKRLFMITMDYLLVFLFNCWWFFLNSEDPSCYNLKCIIWPGLLPIK